MTFKNINDISKDSFILYHHLGLGDVIICNGLVNYISNNFKTIHLIVDKKFYKQISFLYSENNRVQVVAADLDKPNHATEFVTKYANENRLEILKVGWENIDWSIYKKPFNVSFYKQLGLKYSYSYDYFHIPNDKSRENTLINHLVNYYNADIHNIKLVHKTASNESYELKLNPNENYIYIEKESDLFNNMFLYSSLIEASKEIHCINSSFSHLTDRINNKSKLYYHNVRGKKVNYKLNWKDVRYED
jgi:hypothetical protein